MRPIGLIEHGGRLRTAALEYGIPLEQWIDLSTGINPNGWPVPLVPPVYWNRLPETHDDLEIAAKNYYGNVTLLPIAGSQAAIQALPRLRAPGRVGIPRIGYAEHARAWAQAGHEIVFLANDLAPESQLEQLDVWVVLQPNNPTGEYSALQTLLQGREILAKRGGWLIVDEAFIDPTPENSILPYSPLPGLIVLRSLGKFFGLAGARVGFITAEVKLLKKLEMLLGPWALSAPARWVAHQALMDTAWQINTRSTLKIAGLRLAKLLAHYGWMSTGNCALFQWLCTPNAAMRQVALAQRGILIRYFEQSSSLRLGLPGNETAWQRLATALADTD